MAQFDKEVWLEGKLGRIGIYLGPISEVYLFLYFANNLMFYLTYVGQTFNILSFYSLYCFVLFLPILLIIMNQ